MTKLHIYNMLYWFQKEFPHLMQKMENASHHYDSDHLNPYHLEGSIWTHTLMVLKNAHIYQVPDVVKWSALLHDVGKPYAREVLHDRQKIRFIGHEGVSTYVAIDILNKTTISRDDKIEILKIIALHDQLFHHMKADGSIKIEDMKKKFIGNADFLQMLSEQVRCDSLGRYVQLDGIADHDIDTTMKLPEIIKPVVEEIRNMVIPPNIKATKKLTLLIGPPCSGKSTWVANSKSAMDFIISRDAIIEEMGAELGLYTYSESYQAVHTTQEKKDQIDIRMQQRIDKAKQSGKNVIIDMTNMSLKSRKRWLSTFNNDYSHHAVLFLTSFETLLARNEERIKSGKKIPYPVLIQMLKSFHFPLIGEGFDTIDIQLVEELSPSSLMKSQKEEEKEPNE